MFNSTVEDRAYEAIGDAHWQILEHASEDLVVKAHGYRYVRARALLFHAVAALLCGVPYLFISWYPRRVLIKYQKSSLRSADLICVTDNEGTFRMEKVEEVEINLSNEKESKLRYFTHQHCRFIWHKDQAMYVNVMTLNEKLTISYLMENTLGINKRQQAELTKLYGPNKIVVEVKSYWSLFVNEVFNPFYLFQVFSIILWSLDEYYQYAACVFAISAVSCGLALKQTKKTSISLHNMVMSSTAAAVSVVRPARAGGREECVVDAGRLVPGDILLLPPAGCVVPCDALLLTGTCIVDEGTLTGESVPVMKAPPNISSELYSTDTHKRHTLFSGTHVIQTRFYGNNQVLARVVRTGFYTAKGEMMRSILFPKPVGFQFYKDSAKFVIFLFCIAAIGMTYCIWLYVERGTAFSTIILRTLDIITIVVPPALPAAMTAGTLCSQSRLKKKKLYCVSPPRINVSGKLQVFCFDKTGTLTEDSLELYAVIPHWGSGDTFGQLVRDLTTLPATSPLMQALASCHSLTSVDEKLTGDPLDLKMFEATQWVLEEPGPENTRYDNLAPAVVHPPTSDAAVLNDMDNLDPLTMEMPYEIGLLRRFHFSSTQQSMGVITRALGQPQMVYFVKGAPEKVAGMCRPESLPSNFSSVLNDYASRGFRVIGIACKKLERRMKWVDTQRIKREQLECDLTFLGLLVMLNSLKPQTTDVIRELSEARIRTVMVTGECIACEELERRMKWVDAQRIKREQLECDLTFLGLLVMLNSLKPQRTDVLRELSEARIRTVMVTGDNIMTAMSVARMCAMVPQHHQMIIISTAPQPSNSDFPSLVYELVGEAGIPSAKALAGSEPYSLALEGRTWAALRHHYPHLLPHVLERGVVFARFGPDQKTQLISGLQAEGLVVGMCGDGANDCGALKASHIGISLSEAEASVAAPFTYTKQNISCVKLLALEGRCALSTSFSIFKYMALYSLIQFFSVLILYNVYSILGNLQFLYIDLVLTTVLAMSMGRTGPSKVLSVRSPPVSLVALSNTVPLMLQVLLCLVGQLLAFSLLHTQPWYVAIEPGPDVEEVKCWDNTAIFIVSSFQYLVLASVYSKGEPFRERFCRNYYMLGSLVVLVACTVALLACPWDWMEEQMELQPWRDDERSQNWFRGYLLLLPVLHFFLSLAIEAGLSDGGAVRLARWCKSGKRAQAQCDARAPPSPHWLHTLKNLTSDTQIC